MAGPAPAQPRRRQQRVPPRQQRRGGWRLLPPLLPLGLLLLITAAAAGTAGAAEAGADDGTHSTTTARRIDGGACATFDPEHDSSSVFASPRHDDGAGVCGPACRAETQAALEGIYRKLNGTSWAMLDGLEPAGRGDRPWHTCGVCGNNEPDPHSAAAAESARDASPSAAAAAAAAGMPPLPDYCCWKGVFCCEEHAAFLAHNMVDGGGGAGGGGCARYSVTGLQLYAGLRGQLAAVIPQLDALHRHGLRHLDLSKNQLSGTLPPEIGRFERLTGLLLGSNNLSGTVPPSLGALRQLAQLDLEFNRLGGDLARGQLCPDARNALDTLLIRGNNFTGGLDLRNCRALKLLDCQGNRFSGPLPVDGANTKLAVLRAEHNYFGGSIPAALWDLPDLMALDLTNNSITGTLPQSLAANNFLTQLRLSSNSLTGTVPFAITTLSHLADLDLSDNPDLYGTLPKMTWMFGLQSLNLRHTRIEGTLPAELARLPYLESVDVRDTRMTCCATLHEALERKANGTLLPSYLALSGRAGAAEAPAASSDDDDDDGGDLGAPLEEEYLTRGGDVKCGVVRRARNASAVPQGMVSKVVNVSRQAWRISPEYSWFMTCVCAKGYEPGPYVVSDFPVPCRGGGGGGPAGTLHGHAAAGHSGLIPGLHSVAPRSSVALTLGPAQAFGGGSNDDDEQCVRFMSVMTCRPMPPPSTLSARGIAGLAVAAFVLLGVALLLHLTFRRASKVRHSLEWYRKHLAGVPRGGSVTLVVTDVEGYTGLFKRFPERTHAALMAHNVVVRRAKYAHCGSILQTEGDSYALAFHAPFDAVAFCLQVQLALMEVAWPEGLSQPPSDDGGGGDGGDGDAHQQQQQQQQQLTAPNASPNRSPPRFRLVEGVSSLLLSAGSGVGRAGFASRRSRLQQQASSGSSASALGDGHGAGGGGGGLLGAAGASVGLFGSVTGRGRHGGHHQQQQPPPPLFNGLRVRMGVVTGVLPEPPAGATVAEVGAAILASPLYKLALDVSDAANGGQVLLDEATFLSGVKEDLAPLGAVDASGLNFRALAARRPTLLQAALRLACGCRGGAFGPHAVRVADEPREALVLDMGAYRRPCGPGEVALLAAAAAGAAGADGDVDGGQGAGACGARSGGGGGAGQFSDGGLAPPAALLPGAMTATAAPDEGSVGARFGAGAGATPLARIGAAATLIMQPAPSLPNSPLSWRGSEASGAPLPFATGGGGAGGAPGASAAGAAATGGARGLPPPPALRLLQVLHPRLAGRAAVWGNALALRGAWVCVDAPYFDAPGAASFPLGGGGNSIWRPFGSITGGSGSGSYTTAAAAAPPLPGGVGGGRSLAAAAAAAWPPRSGSGAQQLHDASAAAGSFSSSGPRTPTAAGCGPSAAALSDAGGSPSSSPGGSPHKQPHPHKLKTPLPLPALAPMPPPPPPVTVVFASVEGAKQLVSARRRGLARELHATLSGLLMEALRHVAGGGYMCRMQPFDLKYMAAFSCPAAALEWCLVVQEASMYLCWPDERWARVPVLRREYDESGGGGGGDSAGGGGGGALLFRGPRLRMGLCEGVPRGVAPDHLGRADYHGPGVNQAARYMDAAARGGQVVCELDTALGVLAAWAARAKTLNGGARTSCSSGSGSGARVPVGSGGGGGGGGGGESSGGSGGGCGSGGGSGGGSDSDSLRNKEQALRRRAALAVNGDGGDAPPPAPPSPPPASYCAPAYCAPAQAACGGAALQPPPFALAAPAVHLVPVEVADLGRWAFKGVHGAPSRMASVGLAALAGRARLLPDEPPRGGKGGRLSPGEGGVAAAGLAPLPALASAYRARVPPLLLEAPPVPPPFAAVVPARANSLPAHIVAAHAATANAAAQRGGAPGGTAATAAAAAHVLAAAPGAAGLQLPQQPPSALYDAAAAAASPFADVSGALPCGRVRSQSFTMGQAASRASSAISRSSGSVLAAATAAAAAAATAGGNGGAAPPQARPGSGVAEPGGSRDDV